MADKAGKPKLKPCPFCGRAAGLRDSAHDLAQALELAIRAMNTVPSFDTGITNPDHPKRSLSSYQLLPKLEAILKTARGQA